MIRTPANDAERYLTSSHTLQLQRKIEASCSGRPICILTNSHRTKTSTKSPGARLLQRCPFCQNTGTPFNGYCHQVLPRVYSSATNPHSSEHHPRLQASGLPRSRHRYLELSELSQPNPTNQPHPSINPLVTRSYYSSIASGYLCSAYSARVQLYYLQIHQHLIRFLSSPNSDKATPTFLNKLYGASPRPSLPWSRSIISFGR